MKKENINYKFTAIPTNLFYLLDNNCRSVLFCLIQSSNYYSNKDGFFFMTKETIGDLTNLSINVVTAAIDTLYINGIIKVTTVGKSKGKYVNHYKVNYESFTKYENLKIEELRNPELKINTVKYKGSRYQPQYIKDYLYAQQDAQQYAQKVITNKDNIDNKENKNNNKNISSSIYNKENTNNKEKENNTICIHTTTKEKESGSWLCEDDYSDIELFNTTKESYLDQLAMRVANNKLNFEFN